MSLWIYSVSRFTRELQRFFGTCDMAAAAPTVAMAETSSLLVEVEEMEVAHPQAPMSPYYAQLLGFV